MTEDYCRLIFDTDTVRLLAEKYKHTLKSVGDGKKSKVILIPIAELFDKSNLNLGDKMRTLLIDGDILIYKIATLNEEPTHWGEGLWTLHCDENICKAEVDRQIDELLDNLKADKYIVALTDKKNFRKDILPSYKDNRKQKRKPLALPFLRQHCIDNAMQSLWTA